MTDPETLEQRVELLSESIQSVQITLAEKKKPWYQQHSLVVSIAALVFTILFNSYGIFNQKELLAKDSVAKNLENLERVVDEIVELRSEDSKDAGSAGADFAGYSARNTIRNTKRLAALERADALVAVSGDKAPSVVYGALANEAFAEGLHGKADRYFELAVNKAPSGTNERMWALFVRGQIRFTRDSQLFDLARGREFFRLATHELTGADETACYQRAQLQARIGQMETIAGDPAYAKIAFESAVTEGHKLNPLNPMRMWIERYIAGARQAVTAFSPTQLGVTLAQPETWMGSWRLRFSGSAKRTGTVTFVSGPAPNLTGAYVDIFDGSRLVEKAIGQAVALGPARIRIDWSGQRLQPIPSPTVGYSILEIASGKPLMRGEQFTFGEEKIAFVLTRSEANGH